MQESRPPEVLDLSPVIAQIVDRMGVNSMLYYGSEVELLRNFKPGTKLSIEAYKDSIIGCEPAGVAPLVVTLDYLHSVGMLKIGEVLDDLKRVTINIGFFHVRTEHEIDGLRTIHQPISWWLKEFIKRFELQTFQRVPGGFYVIVYPRSH